jgi:L-ascorbate metabolism protein UlaG (beta-lactamase superfamily)
MKITWLGHSCFQVEKDGYSVIFDPYEDGSVPGLAPVRAEADEVFCSHEHHDHNAVQNVTLKKTGRPSPFTVTKIETYHDPFKGAKRGTDTIHILDDGNTRLAHLGDLGCELEPKQKALLKDLDVLLIPVGGFYTIDAAQAAELVREITPKIVIPMHFRDDELGFGYDVIGEVTQFTDRIGTAAFLHTAMLSSEDTFDEPVVVLQPLNRKNP